jgi:predicted PurR-regulated permease PerM
VSMASPDHSGSTSSHGDDDHLETPSAMFTDLAIRLSLVGMLAYWSLSLVRPFLTVIMWSIVLAVALFPVYEWLAARLGGRRGPAAVLITFFNLLVVFGPVTWLGLSIVDSLRVLSERFVAGDVSIPLPFEWIKSWPIIGDRVYEIWNLASTNLREALVRIAPQLKPLGSTLLGAAATTSAGMLQFIASVIVAGFLFSPGPSLVRAVKAFSRRSIPSERKLSCKWLARRFATSRAA